MQGRAVILLEPDYRRARKILFEPQDIAHFGTAPAINRLIVIAHTTDVLVPPRQEAQPEILRDVGILILVHEDIAEPALVLSEHVIVLLKDRDHMQEQIAEIDRVQLVQAGLILPVERRSLAVIGAPLRGGQIVGRPGAVLPLVDDPRQHPRGPAFVVNARRLYQLLEQAQLVVCVQNGEIRLEIDEFGVTAQELDTDRMKRAEPRHALDPLAHQAADTFLHLARGLVGKGHGQNITRPRATGVHQMYDTRGQRLGLARARPCQHQHGTIQCLRRTALLRVEVIEIGRRPRSHGTGREAGPLKGIGFVKAGHTRNFSVARPGDKGMFDDCSVLI